MNAKSGILGLATVLVSLIACGQQTGSGGGSAAGAGAPGASTVKPAVPPASTAPPAQQKPNPLSPGANNRQQLPPGLVPPTNSGVGVIDTNQPFLKSTNSFGANQAGTNATGVNSNQFGVATNQFGLTPSGSNSLSSQTGVTNSSGTNVSGITSQDIAISQADRVLLARVRQSVSFRNAALPPGTTLPGANVTTPGSTTVTTTTTTQNAAFQTPIRFMIRDGVVTIFGFVPTLEERQQIEAAVSGVSGVNQVVDNLRVRSRDVAVTAADQALLAQVRAAVQPVLAASSVFVPSFVTREGVVAIVGAVDTTQESQQIEAAVAQVPGVIRVGNQLWVRSQNVGAGSTSQGSTNLTGSAPLLPNRFNLPQTNQVGASTNVLMPTSRFNSPTRILSTNNAGGSAVGNLDTNTLSTNTVITNTSGTTP